MAGSKYYDTAAVVQVIGSIIKNPDLMDDSEHFFRPEDFCNEFHKVVFGAMYNLHLMGAEKINSKVIEDYLENHPESLGTYRANNGSEWIYNAYLHSDESNFEFYYGRLKKMTLLRTYDEIGFDVSWIYDPDNIFDSEKKEKQEHELDEASLSDIADKIDNRIQRVRDIVVDNEEGETVHAGEGLEELLMSFKEKPLGGEPLFDPVFDRIVMGARLGCFYLRSGSTGAGKSRTAMADACYLACSEMYDTKKKEWIDLGIKHKVLLISVELDEEELGTLATAFVSGVPEDVIVSGQWTPEVEARILKAAKIVKESGLLYEYLPDYSMKDIENSIKKNLRIHKCQYVFN